MAYEYTAKEGTIRINWSGSIYGPSIEDYEETMAKVMDILIENKRAESIILAETREYEYGYEQTQMLLEIAGAVRDIIKGKKLISKSAVRLGECEKHLSGEFSQLQDIILNKLRGDPIGAFVEIRRMDRYAKIKSKRKYPEAAKCYTKFIEKVLKPMMDILEGTELIKKAKPFLSGYHVGDREIYREIFHPTIRPNFMRTKYMSQPPGEGKVVDRYEVSGGIKVEIYQVPGKLRYVYHASPPEFRLSEDKYTILDAARRYMKEHRPRSSEFSDPERMREVFFNIGKDMIMDIAEQMGVSLSGKEADDLAGILTRYTAGLGILELLLADKKLQDIYVNSPVGRKPVFVFHEKYQECETNLIPTNEDAESWATRFRLMSGRPLDEANPVLDTETSVPGGRARIAVITRTLSPGGLGFSIRRHRDKPWTYPLFINNNFFDPLFAGLMSFILDGSRSMLIAGTRSSGKTSLLGASMLELMRKTRMVTCEDSVAGDSRILIRRNGKFEKTTVGDLVDDLIEKNGTQQKFGREIVDSSKVKDKIEIPSFDEKGGYKFKQVSSFIRHRTDKDIYEVETSTGRKLKVTGDHSLFGIGDKSVLKEIKVKDMKPGGFVAVPRKHKIKNKPKQLNLMEHLDKFEEFYIEGEEIKGVIEKNLESIKKLKDRFGYSKKMHSYWKNNSILPVKIFRYLDCELGSSKPAVQIKPKNGGSPLPVKISLDEDFLTLIGLWIADGYYDKKHVLFSVAEEELRDVVKKAGKRIGIETTHHSDGFTLLMNSTILKTLMKDVLELKGDAYTKRIPGWVYNLSETQMSHVLKGIFSGDGCIGEKEILIPLASDELLHDIQTLLLNFDIILRRANHRREDETFNASITALKFQQRFRERIGILTRNKRSKLYELCSKTSTHNNSDIIPISLGVKTELNEIYPEFNKHDYITRKNNIGREKLKQMVPEKGNELNPLGFLAESDILWDKITKVKKLKPEKYVYDFSVPGNENFVCENILAHNTLELPVERLRELGFNIERLKSRSVITRVETELPAEEAIRTALRLGDSSLILGEVRSSLRGDEKVFIVENGETKRVPIKDIENRDYTKIMVPTLDGNKKIKLSTLTDFVKHPKREELFRVRTNTGREITVTPDHSLFTTTPDFRIKEIETNKLKPGSKILIPAKMPCGYNNKDHLDLTKFLPKFKLEGYEEYLKKAIKKIGWKKATKLPTNDILRNKQKTKISVEKFKKLMKTSGVKYNLEDLSIKNVTSKTLPAKLPVNRDFCRFLGYYLAEGYITREKQAVIITNSNKKIIDDIVDISTKNFNTQPYIRSVKGKGRSTKIQIQNPPLANLLLELGIGRTSSEKRIPSLIYGLNQVKISSFLKGAYSGDGSFTSSKSSGNRISYFSTHKKLAEDMMYLLLALGIVARIHKNEDKGRKTIYSVVFKQREFVERFLESVGFSHKNPMIRKKSFSHSAENSVEFDPAELEKLVNIPREFRHLRRHKRCSKDYLKKLAESTGNEKLKKFANGEFYLDKVKNIEKVKLDPKEYVFDLSVNPTENFIGGFGGIILHNTEAKALYEAMRIGALANTVAGTIHGDSPYGVFDRVTNDLGVPPTSFKATDIIVVANMLRSASGLSSFRRVTGITEVRKHWKEDPSEEGGFMNLMEYSSKDDKLKPTDTLLNGESYILNEIARNVPQWRGNWAAVWENINLRGDIKKTIVDQANKMNRPDLMEASFNLKSNNQFHIISEMLRKEVGTVPRDRAYNMWWEWFKKQVKKGS